MQERDKLQQALEALERQRDTLGDDVVETTRSALLASLSALAGDERRSLITVLFADMSGFTAFSEQMDAEEVQDLLGRLWGEIDQIIVDCGGRIDKHMGDRVMAVWGVETPREDDPARAVDAALEIQRRVGELGEQFKGDIALRIGIHTGLASVGRIASTGELNIVGDTVNLASRLERGAPDKGILVSKETFNRVRGLYEMEEQPALTIRGKAEPVQTFLVGGRCEPAFRMQTRGLSGVATRTIGREGELEALKLAYQQCCLDRTVQWITIHGEAGVGKTRLLADFESWVRTQPGDPVFLRARAWSHTVQSPYFVLRGLLSHLGQIGDSDSLPVARGKLTSAMVAVLGDETGRQAAALLGHLVGLDFRHNRYVVQLQQDRKQIRRRAAEFLASLIGALSAERPVLILLEDLQWADEESVTLLGELLVERHPWPLMTVALGRPEFWDRGLAWGSNGHHRSLELVALRGESAEALVRELLKKVERPPAWLVEMLVEQGGGNPYFTEELVNWLVEQGMIEVGPSGWLVRLERPLGLSVPGTIQGVLQTRLEGLGREDRAALQWAAVVGPAFWGGAVDFVGGRAVPTERWDRLVDRGLIVRRPTSQLPGEDEYLFKHMLLHDVVHQYTLRKERQLLHRRAAEWLSRVAAERAAEWAAVIASHYEQAREVELAAVWYERAGRQAREIYALGAAIGYFRLALALLPGGGRLRPDGSWDETVDRVSELRRVQLFQGLGEILRLEARFSEAAEAYIGMLAASQAMGDSVLVTQAWNRAFSSLQDTSATLELGILDDRAGTEEQRRTLEALRLNLRGAGYQMLGSEGPADPYMENALEMLGEREPPDPEQVVKLAVYAEALTMAERTCNLGGKMLCLTELGRSRVEAGDLEAAETDLASVIELSSTVSWHAISRAHRLLAEAYLGQDRHEEALQAAARSLELANKVGRPLFAGWAWLALGRLLASAREPVEVHGETLAARTCFERSEQAFKVARAKAERATVLERWAGYEAEYGDPGLGEELAEKARRILGQPGVR